MDRENKVSKIFIISLVRVRRAQERFLFTGNGEYGPLNRPITASVLTKRYNKVYYYLFGVFLS